MHRWQAILAISILGSMFVFNSCSDSNNCPSCPGPEATPNTIDDLATGLANFNSVVISWTAPDSALEYDIRYSTAMIDSANWATATQAEGEPSPQNAGKIEIFRLTHLNQNTGYYIAIKFRTDSITWSALSNVASCYTSVFDSRGKIVFSSDVDDQSELELFMINSDGSDLQRLTYNLSNDYYGNFSLDGNYLFFVSNRTDGNLRIYAMDLVADSTSLVYSNTESDAHVRCAYSAPTMVFNFYDPAQDMLNVYTMNYDGSNRMAVTHFVDSVAVYPDISADGSKIVYIGMGGSENWTATIDADGSNMVPIKNYAVSDPAWSPDGTKIAYSLGDKDDIYVMSSDGTGDVNLTNDSNAHDRYPRWSPDGTKIVFASDRDGDYEIYVMDSDGSNVVQLTDNNYDDIYPSWSPVQ